MVTFFQPARAFIDNQFVDDPIIAVEDGRITAIHRDMRTLPTAARDSAPTVVRFDERLMLPGLVNSQSHPFHVLLRGFVDDLSYYAWREQGLYRLALDLEPDDVYHGSCLAFAEMIQAGITTAVDFFYLHHKSNDHARAVARAARRIGIRLVLARGLLDWHGSPEVFREPVSLAVKNTTDLMAEFEDDPLITILPAPHSVYAASTHMLEAASQLALDNQTRLYLHLGTAHLEREVTQQTYGCSPLTHLQNLGLVNANLTIVHATTLTYDEIHTLANARVTVVHTPTSQMMLGAESMRLHDMLAAGLHVALGTDSPAANNRLSIFDEARLAALVQKSMLRRGDAVPARDLWPMATRHGGLATGLPIGRLAVGQYADFLLLDLHAPTLQPPQRLFNHLIYGQPERAITAVYIAGQPVLDAQQLTHATTHALADAVAQTTQRWR